MEQQLMVQMQPTIQETNKKHLNYNFGNNTFKYYYQNKRRKIKWDQKIIIKRTKRKIACG